MLKLQELRVRLFSDGADLPSILEMYTKPWICGFTTNPTLMRRAGVRDYEAFARALLRAVPDRPISLEVFADDEAEMEKQALTLASWGPNVNVKIPVTNRSGSFQGRLIRRLSSAGVSLNVTALLTVEQVRMTAEALDPGAWGIVSVFAGRIADTGVDPVPIMSAAKRLLESRPGMELLWASPRELLNIFQADEAGCDIITVPPEMLRKLELVGKDLTEYSRETVEMFHRDARTAGYVIRTSGEASCSASGPSEDDVDGRGEVACAIVGMGIGERTGRFGGGRPGA
jgi:transaldolase